MASWTGTHLGSSATVFADDVYRQSLFLSFERRICRADDTKRVVQVQKRRRGWTSPFTFDFFQI
jgi:hypothetical protein